MTNTRCTIIDKQVANNVKQMRLKGGISQKILGEVVKVSVQQIKKYENGVNRISASTLLLMARFFKAPLEDFYQYTLPNDNIKPIEWCSTIKKSIADNIMKIRKTYKMNRHELAYKLNIPIEQVINYEKAHDEIPGTIIYKLSVIFNKPITDIYAKIS